MPSPSPPPPLPIYSDNCTEEEWRAVLSEGMYTNHPRPSDHTLILILVLNSQPLTPKNNTGSSDSKAPKSPSPISTTSTTRHPESTPAPDAPPHYTTPLTNSSPRAAGPRISTACPARLRGSATRDSRRRRRGRSSVQTAVAIWAMCLLGRASPPRRMRDIVLTV